MGDEWTDFLSGSGDEWEEWQPKPTVKSVTYLRKNIEKYKILAAVNIIILDGREVSDQNRYRFLGNVIHQFQHDGKSVNFICFLYDYFPVVPPEVWPRKEEILKLLSPHLPKPPEVTHPRLTLQKVQQPNVMPKKGLMCGGRQRQKDRLV